MTAPNLMGVGTMNRRMGASFTLISLTVLAIVGLAGPVGAVEPERSHSEFDFEFTNPAGALCSFRVHLDIHEMDDALTFVDASGSVTRIVDHVRSRITFTNLSTGASVVSLDRYTVNSYPSAGSFLRGSFGRVMDSSDHTLFTFAGVVMYDENFNQVFVTPHAASERFGESLCPALS